MDDSSTPIDQDNVEMEDQQDNTNGMNADGSQGNANKEDPYGVKKRLGQQAKKHEREMREMKEQLREMHSRMSTQSNGFSNVDVHHYNQFTSPGQPSGPTPTEDERIQRAVRYALEAKDAETQKAKMVEHQAHVQRQYQRLSNEFDKASDRYDDFDDVVRGDDAPFTTAMRDALLLVDNPADVAYKLGKNREELSRIAKLHPLDQAREVNRMAMVLMSGNGKNEKSSNSFNPMTGIKPNPTVTSGVTDKMPASSIRARMKAGTWK